MTAVSVLEGRENRPSPSDGSKDHRHGTHRLVPPEETLRRIKPYFPEMGITRVADITGLDRVGLPVLAVYRPNARSVVVSQGKGFDPIAAEVSGCMEAIESHHAEHPDLPLHLASLVDMGDKRPTIDVARLPKLTVSSFHDYKPILWCAAQELYSEEEIWVPFEMVHTNYTHPLPTGSGAFQMSSNGLASGNSVAEATSHAICELVERDALALWSIRGGTTSSRGRLNLDTVTDPLCQDLIQRLGRADLEIGVWDITTDIGLPSFVCALVDRNGNHLGQLYSSHGSGTHNSRDIALIRALTEAAQTRLTYIAGARDDAHRELFELARNPDRIEAVRADIQRGDDRDFIRYTDIPSHETDSFEGDIDLQLCQLAKVGIREVAVTRFNEKIPDIAVVRVLIPGLEGLHDAPGYIPGQRAQAHMEEFNS